MHIDTRYQLVNRAPRPDLSRGGRRIHYLHIPKCGGTTLRYVLEGYAAARGLRAVNEARRRPGESVDLAAGDIVMGHHRPADALQRADTCYVTVLRDPVRRLRSHVAMVAGRIGKPVDAVVDRLRWKDANWAVHLLSGADQAGPDVLDRAKQALATRLHLFGFQERFEELMALVLAMLEVEGAVYPAFQTTPDRQRLDDRYDARFAELANMDLALYAYARQLYEERYTPATEPAALHRREPGRRYLCVHVNHDTTSVEVSEATFAP